ncbi:NAD-dependent dehydratase [Candidatus Roizmanbacteria bacterium RIFCSPLOWO2_12_FULL_40_12]|uniref:NAD-dependent dehydratase n=1 Tax=Candidatus Roizmanbacteria bacterium RIFCSPLOWO2_01_FULL_40_42 TaxID=1802066 RepID=A0A1F7J4F7_9BACT|nr:MAG: NAD-dependent dehydratase [Candidatus Roizmanbacteria bacterium RIFCSPHIGHO2_01_FULL_40_98]OGK27258.1 MAG: NAD-dependent dehydratase [Candidatus Roizmanbacteria bacterium RIFCSPHIGHO2_02_FULL_40_53]OGK30870.1 MAG: NAD-dependent dehydratase [Candidatus Roizmanbacteria bacterium RIFCSPHIGHO2_12_41_18]OGK36363.1 MAG: NAD-dependent dehydratase [Candidatus Roizmanbacteria bacterium RIFCSPHIGHO2_12_FULL_40_130]OGK50491.1 MAG: NAD-dependent dehydratase [Candidatus Roizmanbacteria bacterium RIF
MKILVTGGAGFIGSHLCEKLLSDKHDVLCVDNFLTGSQQNIQHLVKKKNFKILRHDVIQPLPKNVEKMDVVFHLASPASPNHHSKISYHTLPLETMLVNTVGTLELLKKAEKDKSVFLFTSSSEVYGDPLEHPQNENYRGNVSSTGPRSVYDEAKRFGETIASHFFRKKNVDVRIARIFNTYGPRMLKEDMRMIVSFITQALLDKPITIFGDGTQTRALCYVDDTVEGLVRFMNAKKIKGEVVNIGSPEERTVLEYAHLVKKLTKSKSSIVYSEDLPEDDPKKRCPDITKASKLLSWKPKKSLESGLLEMIEYVKKLTH